MGKKKATSTPSKKASNGPSNNNKANLDKPVNKEGVKKNNKKQEKSDHSNVTLLANPILTIKVLIILLGRLIKASANFVLSHLASIIGILSLIAAF